MSVLFFFGGCIIVQNHCRLLNMGAPNQAATGRPCPSRIVTVLVCHSRASTLGKQEKTSRERARHIAHSNGTRAARYSAASECKRSTQPQAATAA